jgi:hypothetical protein
LGALHGLVYVPFAGPRLGDTPGYVAAAQAIRDGSYSTPLPDVDVTGYPIPESSPRPGSKAPVAHTCSSSSRQS